MEESQDYCDTLLTDKQNEERKSKESLKLNRAIDTLAFNYSFSFKLFESGMLLRKEVVNWLGETEVLEYPEMLVETELKVDGSTVSKRRFEKRLFEDYVKYHKMSDLILFCSGTSSYFHKDKVIFELNLCVPDTDDCYMFYVNIFTNGSITIEERIIDWDFE